MKRKSILFISTLSLLFFGFQFSKSTLNKTYIPTSSSGAGPGKTGAPGEQNCTACHSGSTQDGSSVNVLTLLDGTNEVGTYVPGNTYTVRLDMTLSTSKKGFQATALLNGSNTMAGDFTSGSNTAVSAANGRKYANHTSASNSGAVASWDWAWTAPGFSASTGDVTFYVASNKANNNAANSGDAIYLSQHTISEESSSSVEELSFTFETVSFLAESNELFISLQNSNVGLLNAKLYDLAGKELFAKKSGILSPGQNSVHLEVPETIKQGAYLLVVKVGAYEASHIVRIFK